jgi:hypothetical protein
MHTYSHQFAEPWMAAAAVNGSAALTEKSACVGHAPAREQLLVLAAPCGRIRRGGVTLQAPFAVSA